MRKRLAVTIQHRIAAPLERGFVGDQPRQAQSSDARPGCVPTAPKGAEIHSSDTPVDAPNVEAEEFKRLLRFRVTARTSH